MVENANFDVNRQSRQIDFLIRSHVKAIVAVPLDSEAIAASAKQAHDAGVLFCTIDRAPSSGIVDMTVQADNVMAGRQCGQAVIEFFQRKYGKIEGTVLQLRGDQSQTVAREREQGFIDVLGKYSNVQLISRDTGWHATLFAQHTQEVLTTTKVDAIYLQSDMIGVPEVLPVLRRLQLLHPVGDPKHIFVTGVDGGPPALKAIREGFVDAVASQPLTEYGIVVNYIAEALGIGSSELSQSDLQALHGQPLHMVAGDSGPLLQMCTTLVNRDNVDDRSLWGNNVSIGPESK